MKYWGLIIALVPLLVEANPNPSIFDSPNYLVRSGFRPSSPAFRPFRIPVARPPMYSNPYLPYKFQYPMRKPMPIYAPYRPLPMPIPVAPNQRWDLVTNLVGGFFPQRPTTQPQPKPEAHKEEEHGHGEHFGYKENEGPETWPEKFPTCAGKSQSPIDIQSSQLQYKQFPKLIQNNYWTQPEKMKVENNGHSIQVSGTWPTNKTPSISGGPLDSEYEFKQMHIHWGLNDDSGSEHLVDGRSFPMELHVVHWNKKYGTYENAASKSDGLAVAGYFFDISDQDNAMLNKFMKYTNQVEGKDAKEVKVSVPLPIGILDLECNAPFVNYKGSLTTPPCSEVVTWIVCTEPLLLSAAQMQELRTVVKDSDHEDMHNYRPPQPLNGRQVYISA